ncbi:porin family protein [Leptolyngbya sp. FACHB-36]|uniref:porin family protein n=1 Tax=Leptolyngbya sp. FACHB-36 TaxID=2692808 RepID=UPI001F54D180|nr:porin family protein [Leptolyngbya sp. FACHB-36]
MQSSKPFQINKITTALRQWGLGVLGGTTIAAGLSVLSPTSASAQAAYGSYVGIGPSFGLTSGRDGGEPSRTTGVLAARYKLLTLPVSVRGQVLFGNSTAIVPTVSYDIPLSWRADAYIGAGASIVTGDSTTPVGNKTSFVLQPGVDYALPNSNFIVFGNAIIAFDAYRRGGNTAVSVQGGVGIRF